MSDELAAAAQAMGIPEALVERSARARAEATGQTYEEVLAAWAGGEAVAAAPAPAPEQEEAVDEAAVTEAPPPEEEEAPAAPAVAPAAAGPAPDLRHATAPARPPILEAPPDRPLVSIAGGLGVLLLVILLGFVFPSLPVDSAEVRTSRVAFSAAAEQGRHVYLSAGCAACHTQAIRSVVADADLGPVSLPDTNQVVGFRRIGPDLSDVGSRLDSARLEAIVSGPTHPPTALSNEDVSALASYLSESATRAEGVEAS